MARTHGEHENRKSSPFPRCSQSGPLGGSVLFQRPEKKEGGAAPAGARLKAGQALGSPCGADGGWSYAYPAHLALGVWEFPTVSDL